MSLSGQIAALATRVGQEIKALRIGKADDSAVLHLSGNETKTGTLTFGSPPQVPVGTMVYHPVRRDDSRLTDARPPTSHAASHAAGGADPTTPGAIGALALSGGTLTGFLHLQANKKLLLVSDQQDGGINGLLQFSLTENPARPGTSNDRPWLTWRDWNNRLRAGTGYHNWDVADGAIHDRYEIKTSADPAGPTPTAMFTRFALGTDKDVVEAIFNHVSGVEINRGAYGQDVKWGVRHTIPSADGSTTWTLATWQSNLDASDNTIVDFDGLSTAFSRSVLVRMFRNLNNSHGGTGFAIYLGNGTNTVQHFLRAKADSYLNAAAGNLGVGMSTAPTAKLHVAGTGRFTDVVTFDVPPSVPAGTAANHPVRRDDTRLFDARPPTAHGHPGSDITSGTVDYARLPVGSTASTVAAGNDARFSAPRSPSGWVDVKTQGAVGDGVADDTVAIQTAIDTSPSGSTIWFPPGTYRVSATIRLAARRAYLGAGGRSQLSTIKAAPALTGGAVLAAAGWWSNATSCDAPVRVEGLQVDAAGVAGAHGLVVFHFWSRFVDLQVCNVAGAGAHGIHVTDRGRDGTTVTTNSHSENTFDTCRFYDHTGGASGFWAESNNGYSNQDGHLRNSFFASIGGYGVRIGRAAGWSVVDNHLYGIGFDGISLDSCYATKVESNYVEDFGGQNTSAPGDPTYGYYNGICFGSVLDTRASILAGNTVSTSQPVSPAGQRWTCFYARAGSGQQLAHLVVTGNSAVWAANTAPTTNRSHAYWLGETGDTGRRLYVEWAGNQSQTSIGWQGVRTVAAATVTLTEPGAAPHQHDPTVVALGNVGAGGTIATSPATSPSGTTWRVTATGSTITLAVPSGTPADGTVVNVEVLASVATTLTVAGGVLLTTGLSAAVALASGKRWFGALRFVTGVGWVLLAATTQT